MAWLRTSQDVVAYEVSGPVPLDEEPLFTQLGMPGQRAIPKTELPRRTGSLDHLDDPARVERPDSQAADENADRRSRPDLRVSVTQRHPAELEHRPPPHL